MSAITSAIVLAAGLGQRMRPITDTLPKPLVQVGGRAMIDYALDRLAEAGIERAVVNVHHLADKVEEHLRGRTRPRILISDERDALLETGGGIRKALPLLGPGPFLALNSDSLWIEGPQPNLRRQPGQPPAVRAGLPERSEPERLERRLRDLRGIGRRCEGVGHRIAPRYPENDRQRYGCNS